MLGNTAIPPIAPGGGTDHNDPRDLLSRTGQGPAGDGQGITHDFAMADGTVHTGTYHDNGVDFCDADMCVIALRTTGEHITVYTDDIISITRR